MNTNQKNIRDRSSGYSFAQIGIKPYQYQNMQINHAMVERAVLEL